MSREEENLALARRYFHAVFNESSVENASAYFSDDLIIHDASHPTENRGGQEYVRITGGYLKALAPFRGQVEDILACEDKVVVRWTFQGTHTGYLMGLAPTQKPASFEGVTIFRMEHGKIVEAWELQDTFTLLQQLELVPSIGLYGAEVAS
jgi:steroid delta-isomerase-like uncharacterized protein